jgi:hypothetical protein
MTPRCAVSESLSPLGTTPYYSGELRTTQRAVLSSGVDKHCLRCARFAPRSWRHFPTAESRIKLGHETAILRRVFLSRFCQNRIRPKCGRCLFGSRIDGFARIGHKRPVCQTIFPVLHSAPNSTNWYQDLSLCRCLRRWERRVAPSRFRTSNSNKKSERLFRSRQTHQCQRLTF